MKRSLTIKFGLHSTTADKDWAAVSSLRYCKGVFDEVVTIVPSVLEQPEAATHPLVVAAMAILHDIGVDVGWGRWLYPRWEYIDFFEAFDWKFYANALDVIEDERQALNANKTFFDLEPIGKECRMKPFVNAWTDDWYAPLMEAVYGGVLAHGGQVTQISPGGGGPPYALALGGIGAELLNPTTGWVLPPFTAGGKGLVHYWMTRVSESGLYGRGTSEQQAMRCCTPAEALEFHDDVFKRLRAEQHPALIGQSLSIDEAEAPVVLQMFQESDERRLRSDTG